MAKENSSGAGRTRSWTIIVYPDSAPDNWRDILDELHIQWVESPLHDKDLNADGEPKKPHWHILLAFDSVKSFDQVREVSEKINAPIPQKCVGGSKGIIRYMAHLDNPEKAQYSISDIVAHGGFDLDSALALSASERDAVLFDILEFIDNHDIIEFCDLVDYARIHQLQWASVLMNKSTLFVDRYIKSRRHKKKDS